MGSCQKPCDMLYSEEEGSRRHSGSNGEGGGAGVITGGGGGALLLVSVGLGEITNSLGGLAALVGVSLATAEDTLDVGSRHGLDGVLHIEGLAPCGIGRLGGELSPGLLGSGVEGILLGDTVHDLGGSNDLLGESIALGLIVS